MNRPIIVYVMVYFEAVASAILRGPSNVVVVAGNNMTMTCEPSPETSMVDWYHTPIHSNSLLPINHGSTILKNFSEFSVEGKMLSLKITQLKHAGFYQCTATGQTASAQLIVLASEPQCNFSSLVIKEETRVNLFCSVSYNGYWVPVMQWSQSSIGDRNVSVILIKENVTESSIGNELTSVLSLVINSSTRDFRYSCKTYFVNKLSSSSQASITATNIPKYESIWSSPVIEMLHGPTNATVSPTKKVFHPGDVLTCFANSTLNPEFEWTEIGTDNILKGSEIVINASMIRDEAYSFSCTVINKLTHAYARSSLVTFTVKNKHDDDVATAHERAHNHGAQDTRPNLLVIITVAATFATMLIAFAAGLVVFRIKQKRKQMLQKRHESPGTVTPPSSKCQDSPTIYAIVLDSSSPHKSVNVQTMKLSGGVLSGNYEEIETESDGTPFGCYNSGDASGKHNILPHNDEDLESSERYSNSSTGSKQTTKSTKYEDLLERDPVNPSVYQGLMQFQTEQDTQMGYSPTSSEDVTQSQTIYVNIRNTSSKFSMKA